MSNWQVTYAKIALPMTVRYLNPAAVSMSLAEMVSYGNYDVSISLVEFWWTGSMIRL
jgi:hypothetical protein